MLPKIIVGCIESREHFFESESLVASDVLEIDGNETNLDDLREWINFCQNVVDDKGFYSMFIWNAGKLSLECQSVLLKPLETKKELTKIFLVTDKESDLLPTILSRCEIVYLKETQNFEIYWRDLVVNWRKGPGSIVSYLESFNLENTKDLLNEVISKIKNELTISVNIKRLEILDLAFQVLRDIDKSNVNKKMALESFLLRSWKVIKVAQ